MSLIKTNAIQTVAGKPILNSTGSILQMVSNFSNTIVSGTADYDVISQSITPLSATSQILIFINVNVCQDDTSGTEWAFSVQRNGTPIRIGSTYGTSYQSTFQAFGTDNKVANGITAGNYVSLNTSWVGTDSPGTTSSVTYKLRVVHSNGSTPVVVGRTGWSGSTTEQVTNGYSITLMEVSA